jgi:hypothetical protein
VQQLFPSSQAETQTADVFGQTINPGETVYTTIDVEVVQAHQEWVQNGDLAGGAALGFLIGSTVVTVRQRYS